MTNQDLRDIPNSPMYSKIMELIDGGFRTQLEFQRARARQAWAHRKAVQAAGHQCIADEGAAKSGRQRGR